MRVLKCLFQVYMLSCEPEKFSWANLTQPLRFWPWSMTFRRPEKFPVDPKARLPTSPSQKQTKIYGKSNQVSHVVGVDKCKKNSKNQWNTSFCRASVLSEVQTSRNSQLPASKSLLVLGMFSIVVWRAEY